MAETASVAAPIQLPIIDISNPDDPAMGKAMIDAAVKYGFFYVESKGSDFSAEDVERTFELSRKFFASPPEEKDAVKISPSNRGWSGMHTEILDPEHQRTGDFKEAMNFGEFKDGKAQQPLPTSLVPHESELCHFAELCNKTCARILKLMSLGLETTSDFFSSRHDPSKGPTGSILRLLYYPSIFSPASSAYKHDVDLRAGAHSDYGSITLLFQRPGQPGLEILTPEGTWAPVPVQPGEAAAATVSPASNEPRVGTSSQAQSASTFPPILINIGDLLSYWTDGLLKSTVHRVVFPLAEQRAPNPQDRYSIAFFCHPVNDTELVPVPSALVARHRDILKESQDQSRKVGFGGGAGDLEPGKRALTAVEHLASRLAATYGFRKEEYSS